MVLDPSSGKAHTPLMFVKFFKGPTTCTIVHVSSLKTDSVELFFLLLHFSEPVG